MVETFYSVFYGMSFLVSLIVIGFLWWLTAKYREARRFWGLLAFAWTLSTLSTVLWGVWEMYIDEDIPAIIDILYFVRYAVVLPVLWLYPKT